MINFGFLDWPISPAMAQAVPAAAFVQNAQNLILVFIYVVYVLLSLAYVVALFGVFFGRNARSRTNAMEAFKGLNAFFIGAISGKLV